MNAPKPAMFTSPPFWSVSVTVATNVSTMSSACFFVTPHFSEMWEMSSALFICDSVAIDVYRIPVIGLALNKFTDSVKPCRTTRPYVHPDRDAIHFRRPFFWNVV